VVYRKGDLSKCMMDRQWSHQVALPAMRCRGHAYVIIRLFCGGLSLCPRTHSFRRDDTDMIVFCLRSATTRRNSRSTSEASLSTPSLGRSSQARDLHRAQLT
jgi:hypothetical protein